MTPFLIRAATISSLLILGIGCQEVRANRYKKPPKPEAGKPQGEGEMASIPAGDFLMGCNEAIDKDCADNEKPSRTVNVAAFQIEKTEVTVAAYGACVKAGSCTEPDKDRTCNYGQKGKEHDPVNCVDWTQADTYCKWAKKRLPTNEEWEKAARGTDGRRFPWGNDDVSCDRANVQGCGGESTPVGSKSGDKSPYGVFDMAGNVMEWIGDTPDEENWHIIRGASNITNVKYARTSAKYRYVTRVRDPLLGFRCAQ